MGKPRTPFRTKFRIFCIIHVQVWLHKGARTRTLCTHIQLEHEHENERYVHSLKVTIPPFNFLLFKN